MKKSFVTIGLVLAQSLVLQAAQAEPGWQRTRIIQRDGQGAVSRDATLHASGRRGTVAAQRSYYRTADGAAGATRSRQVTSAATGNSYHGNATYQKGQGVTYSGGCVDAAGAAIVCRAR